MFWYIRQEHLEHMEDNGKVYRRVFRRLLMDRHRHPENFSKPNIIWDFKKSL
jgi:hypothetical protein